MNSLIELSRRLLQTTPKPTPGAMRLLLGLFLCAALPAQADPRFEALARSLQTQNFAQAESLLGELIGDYPQEPAFRERLGVVLLRRGALPEAQVQLEEAVRLQPKSAAPRLALARVHWLRQDREAAEALLAEVAEQGADNPGVQQALAAFRRQTGDGEAAARRMERAIELAPANRQLRVDLTQLYLDHRTPEGALRAADAALERFASDAELLRLKALALYGLGESQAAIDAFLAAIDGDPSAEIAYASLETLLPEAGDKLPAIVERLEAFSIDQPQSPVGPFLLGVALAIRSHGEPRAPLMLREAVRRAPEFWPAWFELHRPLEQAGDAAGAIEALEKTVALNPEHPEARFALARLYAKVGRKQDAIEARREHHRVMTARREAEARRRAVQPKLAVVP
jgi:predicted Zn-dependent protease